jgi:hypothetical protein
MYIVNMSMLKVHIAFKYLYISYSNARRGVGGGGGTR